MTRFQGGIKESLVKETLFAKMMVGPKEATMDGEPLGGSFDPLGPKEAARTSLLWGPSITHPQEIYILGGGRCNQ